MRKDNEGMNKSPIEAEGKQREAEDLRQNADSHACQEMQNSKMTIGSYPSILFSCAWASRIVYPAGKSRFSAGAKDVNHFFGKSDQIDAQQKGSKIRELGRRPFC
jgi:hypothetical protein